VSRNTDIKHVRVFSGIQPSGALHIGNYIGAIRQWVTGQAHKDNVFCIVDFHAITVSQDPEELRRQTRATAALLIAAGIDPTQSILFVQSHVRAHAEGCWILNCVTPLGWLERMTQFKAKSVKQESVSMGLLGYPVLQAADILLYDTHEVPVGEDQKQHIELTRDIAQRFNHLYGDTFLLPEPVIPPSGGRIAALNDPALKMSKSDPTRGHAIRIVDEPDEIRWVVRRAVTDPGRSIIFSDAPEKAGINNLLQIYESLTGLSRPEIEARFAGANYGTLKNEVADVVVETLRPIRERFLDLQSDPAELDRLLAIGARQAQAIAEPKLATVKSKVGFVLPTP
jgi:tryptophanyl-tRNA synthetase